MREFALRLRPLVIATIPRHSYGNPKHERLNEKMTNQTVTRSKATSGTNSDGSPRICPACESFIYKGDSIKWISKKFKAHHDRCEFKAKGQTHEPSTINNQTSHTPSMPPQSGNVNVAAMIKIARETVTDATSTIIANAERFAEQTAKTAAQDYASQAFNDFKDLAKEYVDSIAPKRIEIVVNNNVTKIDGLTHFQYETLLKLVSMRRNVWMYGAAGGGKSTVAGQVAKALGLRFEHISLNVQSQPSLVMGFRNAHGDYVRTPFRDVYENGGIFLIDEIDAANGNFLTSMNTALANGSCAFPDGHVARHADAIFLGASNTSGNGASGQYNTRNKIDAATRERFAFLQWQYDETLERAASLAINPNAGSWLAWVKSARELVARLSLNLIVSPRASIEGATILNDPFFTFADVADLIVFKGIDDDTRRKVLDNCPLPRLTPIVRD